MSFETRHRTLLATAAILVLVFGTGVLTGLVLDRGLDAAPATGAVATAKADSTAADAPRYMFEKVGLSPQQRAVVDSLVVIHRGRMGALRKQFSEEYDPQYRAIVLATREAIKEVMTPDQAAQYDSLADEADRKRAAEDSATAAAETSG